MSRQDSVSSVGSKHYVEYKEEIEEKYGEMLTELQKSNLIQEAAQHKEARQDILNKTIEFQKEKLYKKVEERRKARKAKKLKKHYDDLYKQRKEQNFKSMLDKMGMNAFLEKKEFVNEEEFSYYFNNVKNEMHKVKQEKREKHIQRKAVKLASLELHEAEQFNVDSKFTHKLNSNSTFDPMSRQKENSSSSGSSSDSTSSLSSDDSLRLEAQKAAFQNAIGHKGLERSNVMRPRRTSVRLGPRNSARGNNPVIEVDTNHLDFKRQ